jgi:hypothetical protein
MSDYEFPDESPIPQETVDEIIFWVNEWFSTFKNGEFPDDTVEQLSEGILAQFPTLSEPQVFAFIGNMFKEMVGGSEGDSVVDFEGEDEFLQQLRQFGGGFIGEDAEGEEGYFFDW